MASRSESKKKSIEKLKARNIQKLMDKVERERKGKKFTTRRRVDGKLVKKTHYVGGNLISNIPKDGQRELVTKSGLPNTFPGGLPKDYKATEQEQIKKVEKWRKSDEYKAIEKKRLEGKNSTSSKSDESKKTVTKDKKTKTIKDKDYLKAGTYFTYKGIRYKAGAANAMRAWNIMKSKKKAKDMAKKRLANK